MTSALYVLCCDRPELLACTLAGVCGFNRGDWPVYAVDDASTRPEVAALLDAYERAKLLKGWQRMARRGGVGQIRRWAIDHFLGSGAEMFVQVESDMLVGPGQIQVLLDAYNGCAAHGYPLHFLNVFLHWWCRKVYEIKQIGPYRVAITMGGSEPFWCAGKAGLQSAVARGLLPADRPDMVLWLDTDNGATLMQPEIDCQHIGAGKLSLYYDYFAWPHTLYRRENERLKDDGPLRQPFPTLPVNFPAFQEQMPASARRLYEGLRALSPVPLPEYPA